MASGYARLKGAGLPHWGRSRVCWSVGGLPCFEYTISPLRPGPWKQWPVVETRGRARAGDRVFSLL